MQSGSTKSLNGYVPIRYEEHFRTKLNFRTHIETNRIKKSSSDYKSMGIELTEFALSIRSADSSQQVKHNQPYIPPQIFPHILRSQTSLYSDLKTCYKKN